MYTFRSYQSDDDYWRIRDFLSEVFIENNRHEHCWPVMRMDYWRWHGIVNQGDGSLEKDVTLWETEQHQLAAILNPEEPGQVFLQIHPNHKTPELEEQMIAYAQEHLRSPSQKGDYAIYIWTDSKDIDRQLILEKRGYAAFQPWIEHHWRRTLEAPLPYRPLKTGYVIRSLGEEPELPSRCRASWRAFHPDEPDEKYDPDVSWYRNIQSAPLYQRDLDLVAIASSGEVAAFTTIWYDQDSRCGFFEPVGCMPEHQRQGLASALLCEGMQRLMDLGATLAIVAGGSIHANALYQSLFDQDYDLYIPWEKKWTN
jgi:mycothiol synthase